MKKIFNKILIIYSCCAFGSIILIVKYSDYFHRHDERQDEPIILDIKYAKFIPESKVTSDQNVDTNLSPVAVTSEEQTTRRIIIINHDKYDDKVQDEFRLGFRINPPVLTLPKTWQETLRDQVAEMQENNDKLEKDQGKTRAGFIKPKTILLYDSFDWWNFNGVLKCPLLSPDFKCEYKDRDNGDQNGREVESDQDFTVDAVVLVRDFQHTDLVSSQGNDSLTKIYFTMESPFVTNFKVTMNPREYLASYWRGSDIYAPYFKWNYYDSKITRKPQTVDYAMGKTKMAAIVASNCAAANWRLDLVTELQKYMQVDVFGQCGTIDCQAKEDRSSCFEDIKNNYKFYLAFENSNCRDYITEKLHQNAYENDLLPIVYGAHPSDYNSLVPTHSYIHVENFESMKDLANYLLLLNSNDALYNEYFEWKTTGEFVPGHFFCEVCALLHLESNPELSRDQTVSHDKSFELESLEDLSYLNTKDAYDFKEFYWSAENPLMCLPVGQYYWNK